MIKDMVELQEQNQRHGANTETGSKTRCESICITGRIVYRKRELSQYNSLTLLTVGFGPDETFGVNHHNKGS
jgi:hypothetical protein